MIYKAQGKFLEFKQNKSPKKLEFLIVRLQLKTMKVLKMLLMNLSSKS